MSQVIALCGGSAATDCLEGCLDLGRGGLIASDGLCHGLDTVLNTAGPIGDLHSAVVY